MKVHRKAPVMKRLTPSATAHLTELATVDLEVSISDRQVASVMNYSAAWAAAPTVHVEASMKECLAA